ncbi:D-sedoheptulose 7-phosphate isomerase [Candidatus Peregrinibacteria bacterium]|nr:D-sedoheptulose 7-phosphate isomerase [Candidatus Peregrinibacteria bacterium]
MNFKTDLIQKIINESIETKENLNKKILKNILLSVNKYISCVKNKKKILICGNGGSAADSQHFAAELVSKFKLERNGLPAISLTSNTSTITAVGNDYSFDRIFARQIEAIGQKGDILFIISTSGNSENIIKAIKTAKTLGIYIIGLTGKSGGKMANTCDILLQVPSENTPRIQECHIMIIHIICELIEKAFYKK